jgi:hypothetical protein
MKTINCNQCQFYSPFPDGAKWLFKVVRTDGDCNIKLTSSALPPILRGHLRPGPRSVVETDGCSLGRPIPQMRRAQ